MFDPNLLRVGGIYSIGFRDQRTRKTTTFDGEYVGLPEGYILLKGGSGRKTYLPSEGVIAVRDDNGNQI
mgnify:CR=1 FL=1